MSDASNTSSRTVVVACKLPHGLKIKDYEEGTAFENVMGGGTRKVKVFRAVGPVYRIKGPNLPDPLKPLIERVGGYAITHGMPADVFERWLRWNKDQPMVKNHLIFGADSADEVRGKAKEFAQLTTGMEPLETKMKMNGDGRMEFVDERIKNVGAQQVVDGKLEIASN